MAQLHLLSTRYPTCYQPARHGRNPQPRVLCPVFLSLPGSPVYSPLPRYLLFYSLLTQSEGVLDRDSFLQCKQTFCNAYGLAFQSLCSIIYPFSLSPAVFLSFPLPAKAPPCFSYTPFPITFFFPS